MILYPVTMRMCKVANLLEYRGQKCKCVFNQPGQNIDVIASIDMVNVNETLIVEPPNLHYLTGKS